MAANTTTVSFSLPSGNYVGTQSLTLSCAGATAIFYTTNGVVPTDTAGVAGPSTTKITGTSGVISVAATEVVMAYSFVSADSPADGPITAVAIGILAAGVNINFTPAQSNYLQSILNERVQAEATANPAYSGDLANTPTFKQGDLTVAQGALAAMQNAVS